MVRVFLLGLEVSFSSEFFKFGVCVGWSSGGQLILLSSE